MVFMDMGSCKVPAKMVGLQQGDDPPYLTVGTAVSAKYKGAFCEAKVSKVVRVVKCKITYKMGLGTATVTNEEIKGTLRVGHTVQVRHSERKELVDATITKIQDCSQYTVVFDDGDITTLRRTALCLKSGRHFNESETLDQLPLTHPEHFGNPVVGGRRGRRSRQHKEDSSDGEGEEEIEPDLDQYSGDVGKVVCVESSDKKKSKDNWFPGLVVVPSAQPTVRINVREEYLVRSFKDGRYYTVPKKEVQEFSREMGSRIESTALSEAMEKAIKYLDRDELPAHWERSTLFDLQMPDSDSEENYTDSSDDEPREEKDHFVAQLYKFMDDRGTPLNKSPMISNRDVDLYRLFRVVYKIGGYNRVTNQNKWKSVTVRLGYSHNHATYNSVKQAYKKYLFSFEDFYRKLGCTMINHPRNAKKNRGRSLIRDKDRATPVNCSPRPERSEDSSELIEKKEDSEKSDQDVAKQQKPKVKLEFPKAKVNEKEFENEKSKRKEGVETSDCSSNSSDIPTDTQSESGQGTSKEVKKEEVRKKPEVKNVKERKVKTVPGEKVKALVEKFEEKTKTEETKPEEDKTQQTRSKQGPRSKEAQSPDRRDTRTPLRDPINKPSKPKKQEEDKRRGRKRKDTESEKPIVSEVISVEPLSSTQPVNIGDKLKVYYGPTHESKVTYEAKVLEIDRDNTGTIYLVHYTGWNTRYDEWIKPARIAENLSLTTKAKRLKQSQTPGKSSSTSKPAAKRGRGVSVSSRSQEPPRSTTPSSVTSSSSRTKSPATPASKTYQRVTRQGELGRRTRRTSAHTDLSVPSESETELSESESELSRTRSGSKTEDSKEDRPIYKRKIQKRKDDDDDGKDSETEKPKRQKKLKKSETKTTSTESDEDSSSPPKGRDFDLNQIRSELKGFEKAVKLANPDTPDVLSEDKSALIEVKSPTVEKKTEDKPKIEKVLEKSISTEDIYEFKEPEPFEFEARNSKLSEEKNTKKRLVSRMIEEIDKPDKAPKKKGSKSPPKVEVKESDDKKRSIKRTPVKKTEEEEEKSKCDVTPVKNLMLEDAFDKLVESPSFNIGLALDNKPPPTSSENSKPKIVKSLNLDEPVNLFRELPERIGEDSRDHLDLSDLDDTQTGSLFAHKEQMFMESAFSKTSETPIFRGFTTKSEDDKKLLKDGTSDEDDSIDAVIQRALSNDDSTDELFITQPANIYQPKLKPKEEPKVVNPIKKEDTVSEPLDINVEIKEKSATKDSPVPKQISPALQETDSSLLEAISLQTEMLKKEELRETQIKTGTKIADSILQKLNMYKKKEEIKPIKAEVKTDVKIDKIEIKKEIKTEDVEETETQKTVEVDLPTETKKRTSKKFTSREFIEESDTDSSDSEQRLVIARLDEDSQTNPSDKLDFKDTDSNISALQANTDDSQEPERNFKFDESIKIEPTVPDLVADNSTEKSEVTDIKQEDEPDSNISMLLCKETIPGSPAPVPEVPSNEPRVKPKSAKSLLLEMPFASAPGSSNNKTMLTAQVEHKSQQKTVSIKSEPQPLAIPLEPSCDGIEVSAVIDNTPPTTPESTVSNLSPRGDQDRVSPNIPDNESCKSTDSGQKPQPNKVGHYSEEDTLMNTEPSPTKKTREEISAPCKKRRRSSKPSDDMPVKRGRRPNVRNTRANSDSDDTSEHSAPGSTPPTATSTLTHPSTLIGETRLSRSPRPSKYNFIIELDQSLDCGQRISLLQQKLSELRKTYNNVKTELACIDRRRKKLRRREREAMKAAKQEMACS